MFVAVSEYLHETALAMLLNSVICQESDRIKEVILIRKNFESFALSS